MEIFVLRSPESKKVVRKKFFFPQNLYNDSFRLCPLFLNNWAVGPGFEGLNLKIGFQGTNYHTTNNSQGDRKQVKS